MRLFLVAGLIILGSWNSVFAETPDQEIEHLLTYVRTNDAVFIRNGTEYPGKDAAEHLARKRDHFAKEIRTAEDFIERAATRSLMSKEPYRVRTSAGETLLAADWLRVELKRMRASTP